jgi:hypothetical protein
MRTPLLAAIGLGALADCAQAASYAEFFGRLPADAADRSALEMLDFKQGRVWLKRLVSRGEG